MTACVAPVLAALTRSTARAAVPALVLALACLPAAVGADKARVEWKPLSVGGMQEFGQLQKGIWKDINEPFRDEWVDHFGAFFTQEAVVEERLRITVGLGGIFQFPKPEVAQAEFGGSQYKAFFIGPTVAEGVYSFGPGFSLGMGMFPYKYNRDARNLGEYLFRSGPYPTFLTTGGFTLVNDASASLQGFKARGRIGGVTLDALLVTETSLPPLYDWSLAALVGYSTPGGLLEAGAGANFKRLIQVRPSRTTPRTLANAYFQKDGRWYPGSPDEYKGQAAFQGIKLAGDLDGAKARLSAANPAHPALAFLADPAAANLDSAYARAADVPGALPFLASARDRRAKADGFTALADSIAQWTRVGPAEPSGNPARPDYRYFSSAGTLLMARASLDLKQLLPREASGDGRPGRLGREDLRIFSEAALLGVSNYEVYYTRRTQRMPVMVGVNLPAFGLLDLVSLQVERFSSPYANNFLSLGNAKATPFFPQGTNAEFSREEYYDAAGQDDISWSLLLKKQVLPGLELHGQFARDHIRTVGTDWFFGSRLEPNEIIHLSRNWYWSCMVSWSL